MTMPLISNWGFINTLDVWQMFNCLMIKVNQEYLARSLFSKCDIITQPDVYCCNCRASLFEIWKSAVSVQRAGQSMWIWHAAWASEGDENDERKTFSFLFIYSHFSSELRRDLLNHLVTPSVWTVRRSQWEFNGPVAPVSSSLWPPCLCRDYCWCEDEKKSMQVDETKCKVYIACILAIMWTESICEGNMSFYVTFKQAVVSL